MKMTEQQFKEWAAQADWSEEEILLHEDSEPAHHYPDGTEAYPAKAWGAVAKTMTATLPDGGEVEVVYQQMAEWIGDRAGRFEEGYTTHYPEGWVSTECYIQAGDLDLVDADGDPLDRWETCEILKAGINGIDDIDYELLLPPLSVEDIDTDLEDMTMATYTLENDGAPDVRFTGELLASVASSNNNASSYYSGSTGRWSTLSLYKTKGGRFVAQSIGHTQWQGEHTRYKVGVCETVEEVAKFFGHGWLAKHLYHDAGLEVVQDVE